MLAEWGSNGVAFDELIAAVPDELAGQGLFDAFTHEQDIRHALNAPGARDCDAVTLAWEWIIDARTRNGGPAIRFLTGSDDVVAGAGELQATVRASRFELLRATTGRRSITEVEKYEWDPAPRPDLLLTADLFTWRSEPLNE
jgi:hypothetical protein